MSIMHRQSNYGIAVLTLLLIIIWGNQAGAETLTSSTFLGGSANEKGWPSNPSVIDPDGNIFIAGETSSFNLPTNEYSYDAVYGNGNDAFIAKLSPDLSQLLAITYLGGSGEDVIFDLAIDDDGNILAAGQTNSSDFPTTIGVYDESYNGSQDVFAAKLSPDLGSLLASTYIGGAGTDHVRSIIACQDGDIILSCFLASPNLYTSEGAISSEYQGGPFMATDYYLIKLDGDLSLCNAATYIGGPGEEYESRLIEAPDGSFYLSGTSSSTNLPISDGAFDNYCNGALDGYIAHIGVTLDTVLEATYMGGDADDWTYRAALADNGDIYITGHVSETYPTTPGCYDDSYNGGPAEDYADACLSRLSGDLSTLLASTFLGGSEWDWGLSIAIVDQKNIFLAGETKSTDFPVNSGAFDVSLGGDFDVFLVKFDSSLTVLQSATYIGGANTDRWPAVIARSLDSIYIIGSANSSDFPTTDNAYDTSYNRNGDCFISLFDYSWVCGDANWDTNINLIDILYLIDHLYNSPPGPGPNPPASGDANGDGNINLIDILYLIDYIYGAPSGPEPVCT